MGYGSDRKIIDGRDKLPSGEGSDTLNLRGLYRLVAGKADGVTVQVTPVQMEGIYFLLAGPKEWLEPLSIPADYRLSSVAFEVVE